MNGCGYLAFSIYVLPELMYDCGAHLHTYIPSGALNVCLSYIRICLLFFFSFENIIMENKLLGAESTVADPCIAEAPTVRSNWQREAKQASSVSRRLVSPPA